MSRPATNGGLNLSGSVLNFFTIVLGIVAAYFMTIQSLKDELAAKAEAVVVEALDRRLAAFEVKLSEGTVGPERFHRFETAVESRLARIEFYLTERTGEQVGTP